MLQTIDNLDRKGEFFGRAATARERFFQDNALNIDFGT